ncbi:MAG: APC family permease [Planctomycetota bacterium]
MGLGSIIGTGIFVSIALAVEVAGPAVVLSIPLAALVAICNGLCSAELAANHPVSGGTYEYGYRWLRPGLGFLAGWLFLCAKSASAATAALGFAGYATAMLNLSPSLTLPVALAAVLVVTRISVRGIHGSNWANVLIVAFTVLSLIVFIAAGIPSAIKRGNSHLTPFFSATSHQSWQGMLEAAALMFVAFTGYGRIATLGEEVRDPARTIPRAIVLTLGLAMVLYLGVALVGLAAVGQSGFQLSRDSRVAPLELTARQFLIPHVDQLVALGALAAMLGVLLNLILGLSRVLFAMGRRGDMPTILSHVHTDRRVPDAATIVVGILVGGLALVGNVKTTWSFSAFTVLLYYSLTCLAAMQLTVEERRFPRFVPWIGLLANLSLVFWIEGSIWIAGGVLVAVGFIWWMGINRARSTAPPIPTQMS